MVQMFIMLYMHVERPDYGRANSTSISYYPQVRCPSGLSYYLVTSTRSPSFAVWLRSLEVDHRHSPTSIAPSAPINHLSAIFPMVLEASFSVLRCHEWRRHPAFGEHMDAVQLGVPILPLQKNRCRHRMLETKLIPQLVLEQAIVRNQPLWASPMLLSRLFLRLLLTCRSHISVHSPDPHSD